MYDSAEQLIFQNESVLPAQFFSANAEGARIEPLRRLAFAVLIDAIHCFQSSFGSRKPAAMRRFAEAREWLLGPPGTGPFSFDNVCYLVDVDGPRLKRALHQWQELKRAGLPCRTLVRRSPVSRPGSLKPRRARASRARMYGETPPAHSAA